MQGYQQCAGRSAVRHPCQRYPSPFLGYELPDELTAFRAYAEAYPDACLLLVDTYDTIRSGVPNAITVAKELEAKATNSWEYA